MLGEAVKYISVYLMSMLRFIAGPAMGVALGFSFWATFVITVAGMMTTVMLIVYFSPAIRKVYLYIFNKKKKRFTKNNRRFVAIWRAYGIFGVSFLTPVIFSPIIGAALVTALGAPRKKIIAYMLISAVFWAFFYTKFLYLFITLNIFG